MPQERNQKEWETHAQDVEYYDNFEMPPEKAPMIEKTYPLAIIYQNNSKMIK
jgi:hypothetical protein